MLTIPHLLRILPFPSFLKGQMVTAGKMMSSIGIWRTDVDVGCSDQSWPELQTKVPSDYTKFYDQGETFSYTRLLSTLNNK